MNLHGNTCPMCCGDLDGSPNCQFCRCDFGSAVIEPPDSALDALEAATTRGIGFAAQARSPEISQWLGIQRQADAGFNSPLPVLERVT
jgi:hypothetical protein